MTDAGIGGVEVAYVYPLEDATTDFGSAAFLADLATPPTGRASSGSGST